MFDLDLSKSQQQKSFMPAILLVLLAVIIAACDLALNISFELGLKQTLHVLALLISLLFVAANVYTSFSRLWADIFKTIIFLLIFVLWSYGLYLSGAQGNIIVVTGLVLLLIWYSVQCRWFIWVATVSAVTMLVAIKLFAAPANNYFASYALLMLAALSLSVFVGRYGQVQSVGRRKTSPEYIDSTTELDEEIPQPLSERELQPDVAMIHVDLGESSKDWEHILRELHNELKSTADVDQLFKRLLVFMSGALEFEAAVVGMVQERTINKIAAYGPEYMTHAKVRAWNSDSIKRIFKTQESIVNQQEHLDEKGKKKILYRIDIPVISNGKATGVVTILRSSMLFNDYEVSLATSMVFHGMVALRQARLQEEIKRLSMTTASRTLFTREQFIEKARLELDQLNKPRAASLLVIEIDKYDSVEKQYGKDVAVKLYKTHATTIMTTLRPNDLTGRYGNDGFMVLLHETDLLEAKKVAEKIRQGLSLAKCKLAEGVVTSTVSLGLTTASEVSEDMSSLIRKADMGLFVAKESGRNTVKVSL